MDYKKATRLADEWGNLHNRRWALEVEHSPEMEEGATRAVARALASVVPEPEVAAVLRTFEGQPA